MKTQAQRDDEKVRKIRYRAAHREAILAKAAAAREANREKYNAYMREYNRTYRVKNGAKLKEKRAAYPSSTPEGQRAQYLRRRTRQRAQLIERKYGLTPGTYAALLASQGGVCGICGCTAPGKGFADFLVDHCHRTGKTRGLLCSACNRMLGCAKDSTVSLQRAVDYLTRPPAYGLIPPELAPP